MNDSVKQGASVKGKFFSRFKGFVQQNLNIISLVIALFALGVFFASENKAFLTTPNLINILRSAAFLGIVTWGMTLVIISGEIDVSVGMATGFSAVLLGWLTTRNNIPFPFPTS